MKWTSSLITCLTLAALVAQAQDKDPTKKDTPYLPTKVGTEWTYRTSGASLVQRVVEHEKVGDTMCARIETKISDRVIGTEHVAVEPTGLYRYKIGDKPVTKPLQFLRLPVPQKKDEKVTWPVDSTIQNQKITGELTMSRESVSIKVKDKTKEYPDAIKVVSKGLKAGGQDITLTSWFVEGVGMVKQNVAVGKTQSELELVELKIPEDSQEKKK